jgi:cold shock CspA family protein
MARSQETFGKKDRRNKKEKKKKDKEAKKLARKEGGKSSFEDMIAYVDENGMIVDTPPDPTVKKKVIKAENIEIGVPKKEDLPEVDPVHNGKVTFFNSDKGYGFIKDAMDGESYFVHINSCDDEIGEGDKVSFEIERGQKGLVAVRVKII